MRNQQLFNRLGPVVVERIIRQFNDGDMTVTDAQEALGVGRTQVYNLRTKWLASGKSPDFLGLSGGDRVADWPKECVEHLKTLLEASRGEGANFALYADELERKFGFRRDRSAVRRFCGRNLPNLTADVLPAGRGREARPTRRWECASYGELYQHDSTPRHIWGPPDRRQSIILSVDDATRRIMAYRVCERETLLEHFAMLEDSFLAHGLPECLYTDGFTMFGREGEDLKSQFGRMCRAFDIHHRIAPTPQAKGKAERSMQTFQHRLAVVLRAEGVDSEDRADGVARRHFDYWNARHVNDEIGATPDQRAAELTREGRCVLRPAGDPRLLRLFLSRQMPVKVEGFCRINYNGRSWPISSTFMETVWLAIRPRGKGFYVLETRPDPRTRAIPRILAKHQF